MLVYQRVSKIMAPELFLPRGLSQRDPNGCQGTGFQNIRLPCSVYSRQPGSCHRLDAFYNRKMTSGMLFTCFFSQNHASGQEFWILHALCRQTLPSLRFHLSRWTENTSQRTAVKTPQACGHQKSYPQDCQPL